MNQSALNKHNFFSIRTTYGQEGLVLVLKTGRLQQERPRMSHLALFTLH